MDWTDATAPDAAQIEGMAVAARAALPEVFRGEAMKVALIVEEFATNETLQDLEIEDPFTLTGLYDGVPLIEKSVMDQPTQPDTIRLYRRAILDEWVARVNIPLAALVAHVYVHELAHHFGWSDDDIATIDKWWT
ncbi:MAG: neutral zinc metallopeptidase [Boseongicola sp.]|nr:MAG: neutral zinc metallopeptidase [Boseongicola sp.]